MRRSRFVMADLYFGDNGDYQIDQGDFFSTEDVEGQALNQEIQDRIKSTPGDWRIYPRKGSLLTDFQGYPNNPTTHDDMENAIKMALTYDGFLSIEDFEVLVAPVSQSTVGMRIDFEGINKTDRGAKTIKIIYDLEGSGPYIGRL